MIQNDSFQLVRASHGVRLIFLLGASSWENKMFISNFIFTIFIIQVFTMSDNFACAKSKNSTEVNVLAVVQFPFTYHNSERGFDDGIDIRILKTIAQRLNLKLNFTKARNIRQMSTMNLK